MAYSYRRLLQIASGVSVGVALAGIPLTIAERGVDYGPWAVFAGFVLFLVCGNQLLHLGQGPMQ